MLTVTLPWPDKILNPNARSHWAKKARVVKAARNSVFVLSRQAMSEQNTQVPDTGSINVSLTFYPPDKRARDLDNCLASSKATLDGLAEALGVNDHRFTLQAAMASSIGGYVKVVVSAT